MVSFCYVHSLCAIGRNLRTYLHVFSRQLVRPSMGLQEWACGHKGQSTAYYHPPVGLIMPFPFPIPLAAGMKLLSSKRAIQQQSFSKRNSRTNPTFAHRVGSMPPEILVTVRPCLLSRLCRCCPAATNVQPRDIHFSRMRPHIYSVHVSHHLAEEPDKFDKDFNDSESEEDDDDGKEENNLRKNERAAKVSRLHVGQVFVAAVIGGAVRISRTKKPLYKRCEILLYLYTPRVRALHVGDLDLG